LKKKFLYLILWVFIGSIALYYINDQDYNKKYHIENNKSAIQHNLKNWLNRDDGDNMDPKIFDIKRLGNSSTYMVLFKLDDNKIGNAQLVKGRNNKLMIKQAGYGDLAAYTFREIKTNKGRYFLVLGRNPELAFDHIEVKVDYTSTFSYPINVSKNELYYHYKKIPKDLDIRPKIIYYDKENREFTDDELRGRF
jgi:hypothetical protein